MAVKCCFHFFFLSPVKFHHFTPNLESLLTESRYSLRANLKKKKKSLDVLCHLMTKPLKADTYMKC